MKGIIVAPFGTSYEDTYRKNILPIFMDAIEANMNDEVCIAFTSRIIKKILEKRGKTVMNELEALEFLKEKGINDIYVQPLHLLRGFEYEKLEKLEGAVIGKPLLETREDVLEFADKFDFVEDYKMPIVLMGHGTSHMADWVYEAVENAYRDKGYENIFIATVEGSRTIEDVIERLKERNIKEVILRPFMLVAGDHANNDMAGDDDESWKSLLIKNGITPVIQMKGLGEEAEIRQMYRERLARLVQN